MNQTKFLYFPSALEIRHGISQHCLQYIAVSRYIGVSSFFSTCCYQEIVVNALLSARCCQLAAVNTRSAICSQYITVMLCCPPIVLNTILSTHCCQYNIVNELLSLLSITHYCQHVAFDTLQSTHYFERIAFNTLLSELYCLYGS